MAAIPAPFKITYGSQAVGGGSGVFQIEDEYEFHKSYEGLDLQFVVTVVATSLADLDNQSNTLEEAFRDRDKTLKIDLSNILDADGASTQTYTWGIGGAVGSGGFMNSRSTCDKIGAGDMGFSRSYAIHITGELPAQDVDGSSLFTGLQDIGYQLAYEPGGQKRLTITGIYTATPAQTSPSRDAKGARENYENATTGADVEVAAYFTNSFPTESWELISEDPGEDRVNHLSNWTRVYVELLDDQTAGTRDDADIRDHTFTMDEVIEQPGDSAENVDRLREVEIFYECAIVLSQNVTLKNTFENKIRPHIIQTFRDTFQPAVIAVARRRVNYDRTRQRLSCSMTIVYRKGGSDKTVEIQTSVRITDTHHHKLTPTHERNPFSFNVDTGWTDRVRETTKLFVVVGEEGSEGRVGGKGGGIVGGGWGTGSGPSTAGAGSGWIEIFNTRSAEPVHVGMPSEANFLITKITETTVDQYFESPGRGGSTNQIGSPPTGLFGPSGPIKGNRPTG